MESAIISDNGEAKMFNGNSKQDGRGPDTEKNESSSLNNVVDIREVTKEKSLG